MYTSCVFLGRFIHALFGNFPHMVFPSLENILVVLAHVSDPEFQCSLVIKFSRCDIGHLCKLRIPLNMAFCIQYYNFSSWVAIALELSRGPIYLQIYLHIFS